MRAQLARDFERFRAGLPPDFPAYVRETYHIDLSARYLGAPLAHPIGKGSGQLSLNASQLEVDGAAGLAFVVLKTVIAQDEHGTQAMSGWAIHETHMTVERRAAADGRQGWTVTWKGRGWDRSFDDYLQLLRRAKEIERESGMLVIPSVKYHLPRLGEEFRAGEYSYTTRALGRAWGKTPLLIEVDFSPTLAGDALAEEPEQVLRWVREVPGHVRAGAPYGARVALKLMNARFDDDFQLAMMHAATGADALVVFNRLFDAAAGVAYGGWDLSDRNLRVLEAYGRSVRPSRRPTVPLCGTGNVTSGRMILEYARRGCESVQVHTLLQLPLEEYPATAGSRTQRVLHLLVFDPTDGLLAAMLDGGHKRFLDLAEHAHRAR
jgi:dihydroorotate dehydrogenase